MATVFSTPRPPRSPFRRLPGIGVRLLATAGLVAGLSLANVAASSADVSPGSGSFVVQNTGGTFTEAKTVALPTKPAKADVELAIDTTGSMYTAISQAKTDASKLVTDLEAQGIDIQFAVVPFRNGDDGASEYAVAQNMTSDATAVQSAINGLYASGGGDYDEAYNLVFHNSYAPTPMNLVNGTTPAAINWRTGTRKFVVVLGDAPPHPLDATTGFASPLTACNSYGNTDDPHSLSTATELAGMSAAARTLLMVNYGGVLPCYQALSAQTPGGAAVNAGSSLAETIETLITQAFATYSELHFEVAAPAEMSSWLTGNGALTGPLAAGSSYDTSITITVPAGTPAGVYNLDLVAMADGSDVGHEALTVVVYDPTAGFVTGGGWIASPEGAFAPDPSLAGKASFGFVSKYQKGATVPTGNTQFVFHGNGLTFHSSSYDWLVVAGAKAQYKGTGEVSGLGDAYDGTYQFILTATDGALLGGGGPDTFRIKIFREVGGVDQALYDNGADTALGGGSVIIHS